MGAHKHCLPVLFCIIFLISYLSEFFVFHPISINKKSNKTHNQNIKENAIKLKKQKNFYAKKE